MMAWLRLAILWYAAVVVDAQCVVVGLCDQSIAMLMLMAVEVVMKGCGGGGQG